MTVIASIPYILLQLAVVVFAYSIGLSNGLKNCNGYYNLSMDGYFDEDGTGISCSHWMEITKPEPPK